MANTKISQLPSYTGTAADLRWFVMNNSGETITYKFSGYTSPYRIGDGTDSVVPYNSPPSYAPGQNTWVSVFGNNSPMTPGIGTFVWGRDQKVTNSTTSVLMGDGNTSIGNGYSAMIGGTGNSSDGGVGIAIIGGAQNSTTSSPQWSGIFAGQANQINTGQQWNGILSGNDNQINGGERSSIVGGSTNRLNASFSFIGGNQSGTITGGFGHGLLGGVGNTIDNSNGTSNLNTIVGGYYNKASGNNQTAAIYNSTSSQVLSSNWGTIVGGDTNLVDNSSYSQILGGSNNTINCETAGSERFNTIINGSGNTIFDAADNQTLQTIINSVDTTLQNATERITTIGLSGRTINDAGAGTTYVENLKAFRQVAEGFYDNGTMESGAGPAITINVNNGAKQQVTITGGTNFIYFTGNLTGGRLVLKVINTGVGSINWADNSSYTWRLPALTPTSQPTASATDIFVFESFDNANLWLTTHSENLS